MQELFLDVYPILWIVFLFADQILKGAKLLIVSNFLFAEEIISIKIIQ